jgi:ATP-dependent Lon protease
MARPIKNNADYFPHDADMRNDARVKALRRKFGIEGYGVYSMLIEYLTDSDYFECKISDVSIEIIAGDFDIETAKLNEILSYCYQLDLLQFDTDNSILSCKSLDKRLEPLLTKRKRDRNVVIVSENTQSKVKKSKVKESKEYITATKVATLEDRKTEFRNKIAEYVQVYPKEMLRSFFDYWTECNDNGKKMRFEMQKVFELKKRLSKWASNDKTKSNPVTTYKPGRPFGEGQ